MYNEKLTRVYATVSHGEKISTNFKRYSLHGKNVKAYCRAKCIEYNEYMESNVHDVNMLQCDSTGYYSFIGAFNKVYKCQRLSTCCDYE